MCVKVVHFGSRNVYLVLSKQSINLRVGVDLPLFWSCAEVYLPLAGIVLH